MRTKRAIPFNRTNEAEIAGELGISRTALWRYRTGKRPTPPHVARELKRLDEKYAKASTGGAVKAALLDAASHIAGADEALDRLRSALKEQGNTEER